MYSFPNFEPDCCSMSGFNCYFLTCTHVSQEERKVVWYSHFFKTFPQFVVIHTIKGFSVVSEAEVDAFLEAPCFFYEQINFGNLISGSSAFSKSSLYIWKISAHILLKLSLKNFLQFVLIHTVKGFSVVKISWRRKWLPTPVFLPREFHGQRSLVGYSPWHHPHYLWTRMSYK